MPAARAAAPGPIDVVENLAVGVPVATICGLLGMPTGDWPTIRRWSDQTLLTPDLNHPDVRPGSPRKTELVLYLNTAVEDALFEGLGPHRRGVGCLYLKRLSDVDRAELQRIIDRSIALALQ